MNLRLRRPAYLSADLTPYRAAWAFFNADLQTHFLLELSQAFLE